MENIVELNKNINMPDITELSFVRELQNDIVLPDYCDDINRILRVDSKPIIKNKYAGKDTAKLNGVIAVTIVYISEPYKQLRSFNFQNDFEYSFDVPGISSSGILNTEMEISELNCRLLNPRKLTVRTENSIAVKISEKKHIPEQYLQGSQEDEKSPDGLVIERLKQKFESCNFLYGEVEAKIEENIAIEDGPAVNEIIYADIKITVDDIKPLYNKAVVKFTADVKCLYNSIEDKNDYRVVVKKIPSTQIVDVDDLDEKYECVIKSGLSSLKTDIDIDPYGENKIINIDFIAQIELYAYKNDEYEATMDAYTPKFEYEVETETIRTRKYRGIYTEKQRVTDSVVLEDVTMESVMDAVGVCVIDSTVINESAVTVNSNAELSVMIKCSDGEIQNLDCSVPIKSEIGTGEKMSDGVAEIIASISEIEATIEASKLSVEFAVTFECVLFENKSVTMIKNITIDTEQPKIKNRDIQTVIYYPDKNETLWSIAKKYNSQMSAIMKHNKCEGHIADKKIIVIPV